MDEGEEEPGDHHGAVDEGGVAESEAVEEASGLGSDDDSEKIDEEDAAELGRVEMKGRGGEIKVGVGEASDESEEDGGAHAEVGE